VHLIQIPIILSTCPLLPHLPCPVSSIASHPVLFYLIPFSSTRQRTALRYAGITIAAFLIAFLMHVTPDFNPKDQDEDMQEPSEWFFRQRAYPFETFDPQLRALSLQQAAHLKRASAAHATATWNSIGPSNIGGRITTLAVSRQNPDVVYAGAAEGGVLRSTNGGVNWTPLFDNQPSLSMGSIAVDPTDDNIVYAGTGEPNTSGDSYDGMGVFKSTNAGTTWFSIGLEATRRIGKIVIDPLHPSTMYVAAIGPQFSSTPERGVYKSTDGGVTWAQILYVSDSTGVVDIAINPQNPNILLAAAWQRMRGPEGRRFMGGLQTAIYRTTNGGISWLKLSGGLPGPLPNLGRPAVAIAPSNPLVAYAAFADDPGNYAGTYRTSDGGDTWVRTADFGLGGLYSNFGWYFGKVFVSPFDENRVFVMGMYIGKTTDGGATWLQQNTNHVDQHALAFHPTDPTVIYEGNDGGFAKTTNGGATWRSEENQDLYISQFYAGSIDHLHPENSMGGTQDNGTIRTETGTPDSWEEVYGGDGFYTVIDYTDAWIQYAESQYGVMVRTTDNWQSGFGATNGIPQFQRRGWSVPIVIDPTNPRVLYTGTYLLYRSTDRAASWTAISPDLSNGPVPGYSNYAVVTTIDAAKTDGGVVMAGTDDANVWVTTDSGTTWTNVSAGLPDRWVTRVRIDPTDAQTAYVTFSGYRYDTYLPHIFRTTNRGAGWQNIAANLPEAPINVVQVDPLYPERLYIGTDVGCFFSTNSGASWAVMGSGLPNVVVSDMQLHAPTRIARAFTHGRSIWQINLDDLVTGAPVTAERPSTFVLLQNYPNPFNGETRIGYSVAGTEAGGVRLEVFDLAGRRVAVLVDGAVTSGSHTASFNASSLSSGVYVYRLTAGLRTETRKMLLLR
jgi:photosystem II stability/assembly factor-like uncharacterized protein